MKKIFLCALFAAFALVSCKKQEIVLPEFPGSRLCVRNGSGELQENASVKLFHSVQDLIADTNAYLSLQTDETGYVTLPPAHPDTLICLATKNTLSSEFVAFAYTPVFNVYAVEVGQPTGAQLLCGHGSKQWLMTHYSINGAPQPYTVTSTLNADGTWWDTNGNSGAWHFNGDTELVYDYTGTGMTVAFTVLEFTSKFIQLEANQSGTLIAMEMTAVY